MLALDCALVKAKFALVTARLATVTLEKAMLIVVFADACAELMPEVAELEAALSC